VRIFLLAQKLCWANNKQTFAFTRTRLVEVAT